MMLGRAAFDRAAEAMRRAFPEHVFVWHRAGNVTTIKLGADKQIMAIGGTALIVAWLGIATSDLFAAQTGDNAAKSAEMRRMHEQLTAMKASTSALQGEIAERSATLEMRQAFLAALLTPNYDLTSIVAMLPRSDTARPAALLPQVDRGPAAADSLLAPFRKLESDQLAFVDKVTGATEARLRNTQALVRRLGLDPERLMAASDYIVTSGNPEVGGPYLPVPTPVDADPRFKNLFIGWKRLQALEGALAIVPSYIPAKSFSYSSSFGVRFDPFTGYSAMHAGVDMAGRQGDPIYVAAAGTVSLAAWSGAYGNCVEVAHGKGLSTRYSHLSAILVHSGDHVEQGMVIARMGSTGRSTGTHLHYEVRIDGRAVNPRPYLDASNYLLGVQHRSSDVVSSGFATARDAL